MLSTITDLVRNVALIVLLAGFLEMLLPSSEMKRFVKVVMGLFILVSILNPLLSLFQKNSVYEVTAWQDPNQEAELASIISNGEQLSQELNEEAMEVYSKRMAKQIEAVTKLIKGVSWVEADVEVSKESEKIEYDNIKRVVLVIGTGENELKEKEKIIEINSIEIKPKGAGEMGLTDPEEEHLKQQVQDILKDFYNLRDDQIHIVIMSH